MSSSINVYTIHSHEYGAHTGFFYPYLEKPLSLDWIGRAIPEDHPLMERQAGRLIALATNAFSIWSRTGRPHEWVDLKRAEEFAEFHRQHGHEMVVIATRRKMA